MCTTNLHKLSLCFKVPPFHWIDDYRKKFREYILLTRSPSKYFSTFQKLFEDVYICYCCCFYSMCLRCFLLPWKIFSSVQNGRFGENLQNWSMHFQPILLFYIYQYEYFDIYTSVDIKCSKYKWSFKKCVWALFKLPFIVE